MPRRIWDLKRNRVVDFAILLSEFQSIEISTSSSYPPFWAVSHSWTSDMEAVETLIYQYQWPVPLLKGLRTELLNFGAEYVWLDVLCLRQQSATDINTHALIQHSASSLKLEAVKQDEWKVDVPTIGNIYRAATQLV